MIWLGLLCLGAFCLGRLGARWVAAETKEYVVVVDAGHGGDDPGKIGCYQKKEKELNLQIAKQVEKELKKKKVHVKMTRRKDADLAPRNVENRKVHDLRKRVEVIHKTQPDCAISIHQNSYPEEEIHGAQVFYYEKSKEGKQLAKTLQKHLVLELNPKNHREAKGNQSYFLLKKTKVPVVIVECGFLSNPEEAKLLSDEKYQKKVAKAISNGIMEYLMEKFPLAPKSGL